jgi:hypothetical protein
MKFYGSTVHVENERMIFNILIMVRPDLYSYRSVLYHRAVAMAQRSNRSVVQNGAATA